MVGLNEGAEKSPKRDMKINSNNSNKNNTDFDLCTSNDQNVIIWNKKSINILILFVTCKKIEASSMDVLSSL